MLKYSNAINGYDSLNLTKLDVLDELAEIEVGVEYLVDGKPLQSFPGTLLVFLWPWCCRLLIELIHFSFVPPQPTSASWRR